MVNLTGHETGNGGYRQEEPTVTTPMFYSTAHKDTETWSPIENGIGTIMTDTGSLFNM